VLDPLPLSLLPSWAQRIAEWSPFPSTFGFPIEALVGNLSTRELWTGVGVQLAWVVVGAALAGLVFRFGVRRYSAVGN
jgi:ABC-2 type transport system permease protein